MVQITQKKRGYYHNRCGIGSLMLGVIILAGVASCHSNDPGKETANDSTVIISKKISLPIRVSGNHRYFEQSNGQPFFWLGDTGWLLLSKLKKEDIATYFKDRHEKGFNVIQVMLGHDLRDTNVYGRKAFLKADLSRPDTAINHKLGYWQLLDSAVDMAATEGIIIAMVPVWGTVVKSGEVSRAQARLYADFLAKRYHGKRNVVWLNGGDIKGSDSMGIWEVIGQTIHKRNQNQLMSFHPRGRTQSSTWFQNADWMDFNCFQSGHRRYDQDTSKGELHYGEDNYRYVNVDYQREPTKPTLDAEPSYEGIPQGLHDTAEVKWHAADIRRYAYWSVFAGACGFTYGANSVMQFHDGGDKPGAYGATKDWHQALEDTAAGQMKYLKQLLLSHSYFDRVPDSNLVKDQGHMYDYIAATRGEDYILCYSYNGRSFNVNTRLFDGHTINISWFNPRNGKSEKVGKQLVGGFYKADPPGEIKGGNDWVLVLVKN